MDEQVIAVADIAPRPRQKLLIVGGPVTGACLVALTLARYGLGWNGAAWAAAQALLVFLAAFDLETRRIPNRATLPAGLAVLVLRAAFERSGLVEAVVAGAIAFSVFFLFVLVTKGGLGMGDVKLSGLLGLLLGGAVLPALLVGTIVGGVASAAVLAARRGGRGHTIAYGPYLCLGAALAILAFSPPPLI